MSYQVRTATVVRGQIQRDATRGCDLVLEGTEDRHVRTSEEVYALLLVADEEELVALQLVHMRNPSFAHQVASLRKQEQQIALQAVVVLELVYHYVAEGRLEMPSHSGVVDKYVYGEG